MFKSLESRTLEQQARMLRRWQITAPPLLARTLLEQGYTLPLDWELAPYSLWFKPLENNRHAILYEDRFRLSFDYAETKPGVSIQDVVHTIEFATPDDRDVKKLGMAGYVALLGSAGLVLGHAFQYANIIEAAQLFNPMMEWHKHVFPPFLLPLYTGSMILPPILCWLTAGNLRSTYMREARQERCQDIADVYIIDSQYAMERALVA